MSEPHAFDDPGFRVEVREWLAEHLVGEYADVRGAGGPGREDEAFDVRRTWEEVLGTAGWIGLGLPVEHGGRGASLVQQVVFAEEYARAEAPGRVGHVGENLVAPTLVAFGSPEQQQRFLPPILAGTEMWCQGYSEPGAGSDLAAISTRAVRDGDEWVITGQKVWTSLARESEWCFALVRTDPESTRHHGLSYVLLPMDQDGIEVRPIVQPTGGSEFNEVFFDGARTPVANTVGEPGDGWRVAMGTLAFERGVSTLAQQVGYEREYAAVVEAARARGLGVDPVIRDRLADARIGLHVIRQLALKTLTSDDPGAASVSKLVWSNWHRSLGELAIEVLGVEATVAEDFPYELGLLQRVALFARADTIYGGSNEIQRNIIAERVLGLPREPR